MTTEITDTKALKDRWDYILLNGKSKQVAVKNPIFEKGILTKIDDLSPFTAQDEKGNRITPTAVDAENLKRHIYNEFFKKPFKNIIILSGAGSSIDCGGLTMASLWNKVEALYKQEKIDGLAKICEVVKHTSGKKDLEALLSKIDGCIKFVGNTEIEIGTKKYNLEDIKKDIFALIVKYCTIPRPTDIFPHKFFLEKLLQRKQTNPRVKVFTLNYDLLFEYAATDVNAIVIDGFSFTYPRTFSGRFYDLDIVQREGSKLQEEDNFIQRVFHLHKLHGSLNWERDEHTDKVHVSENPTNPLMVYPRDAKYEDSYEQPFFEMMARFQRSLRINNDTILICIGYSFNDKHVNAAIEEALNQNPSFRLAIIDPQFDRAEISDSLKVILREAKEKERIMVISETFADFASHFPEIKTYDSEDNVSINLKKSNA